MLAERAISAETLLQAKWHNRTGQHSIRINNEWRIYFIWQEGGPSHAEIVAYHD